MKWQDLPESENVEDRRGEPPVQGPLTFAQMMELKRKGRVEPLTGIGSDLAHKLGDEDIEGR